EAVRRQRADELEAERRRELRGDEVEARRDRLDRSPADEQRQAQRSVLALGLARPDVEGERLELAEHARGVSLAPVRECRGNRLAEGEAVLERSEEHTSELQSHL